jgi:ankyrin repeat protein
MEQNLLGRTVLHWAASRRHEPEVKLLLEKGADVEVKGLDGWTALYRAASNRHEAVVKLLLEKVDVDVKDSNGQTVLY